MRIAIWQQFSSNHSAHFTIIGIFQSPADTKAASEKLEEALKRIAKWYSDNPDAWENIRLEQEGISDVERELGQQYHINWEMAVLWAHDANVTVFDRFIFLGTDWQADSGAYPMDKLMERLGADVLVSGHYVWDASDGMVAFEIRCQAPTAEVAEEVAAALGGAFLNNIVFVKFGFPDTIYVDRELMRVIQFLREKECKLLKIISTQIRNH